MNVKGSLRKGDMVVIKGKFFTRSWVDDQQRTRTQLQVEADSVGHDLTYGWSMFNRGSQGAPGSTRGQADGEVARQDLDANTGALDDAREPDDADVPSDPGMSDPEGADPGMGDPEMSDPDFEKLAMGLGTQAAVEPVF